MKTIFQGFESYQKQVLPPDAPQVQIDECRRAFYAGAWQALHQLTPNTENTPLAEEAYEFMYRVAGGLA